jgi:hypothetical protein
MMRNGRRPLEVALMATRRDDLKHGTTPAYVRGCVCKEGREHQRIRVANHRWRPDRGRRGCSGSVTILSSRDCQRLPPIGGMPVSLAYERLGTNRLRAVQIAVVLLLLIVIWSAVKRFVIDIPNLAAGTLPEHEFDHRYVQQRWLAYLVSYRFRSRHYTFHRRLGRVLSGAAMISGVFALIFGGRLVPTSRRIPPQALARRLPQKLWGRSKEVLRASDSYGRLPTVSRVPSEIALADRAFAKPLIEPDSLGAFSPKINIAV